MPPKVLNAPCKTTTILIDHTERSTLRNLANALQISFDALLRIIIHDHIECTLAAKYREHAAKYGSDENRSARIAATAPQE